MCWNPTVSLNTFLFSIFVLTLIIYKVYILKGKVDDVDDKNIVFFTLFILSFATMQFIEYKLWNYQDDKDKDLNRFWSILAFLLIIIQPLVSILRMEKSPEKNKLLIGYILFLFIVSILLLPTRKYETYKGQDGHLHWYWLDFKGMEYLCLFLWIVLFFTPYYYLPGGKISGVLGLLTLLISIYYYSIGGSWGSMWCWFVNIISIWYLTKLITGK